MEEDLPGVPGHRGAFSGGNFKNLKRRKSLQEMSDAEPVNHKYGENQDNSAGKQLLSLGAPLNHD